MTIFNWILLLLTAGLFGSTFSFLHVAVAEISPIQLAAARVSIAAAILWTVLRLTGRQMPKDRKGWAALLVLGVLLAAIPYFCLAWGQARIQASLGGILFSTIPVFTATFATFMTDEPPPSRSQALGLGVAFLGVALAIGPDALIDAGSQFTGALVTLVAALSYAIGNLYAKRQAGLDPVVMASGQLVVGSLILAPVALGAGGDFPAGLSRDAVLATLAVGVFGTAVPVLLMFVLIKRIGATRTSLLTFFIPVSSVLISVIFLRDVLTLQSILGFSLIISGAIWFSRRRTESSSNIHSDLRRLGK